MDRWNQTQAADSRPGNYYVSAVDGDRRFLLRGPFASHDEALDAVRPTMDRACELDARGHFMAWGTARFEFGDERAKPGRMNSYFAQEAA